MTISRVRVAWAGFQGAPGVSTFYCNDVSTFLPALNTFVGAIMPRVPIPVTLTIEGSGDIIDPASGTLTGSWANTGYSTFHTGLDGAFTAAPAGLMIRWETGSVINGHKLRGRTFLVPCGRDSFDGAGKPSGAAYDNINVAATTFVAAVNTNMVIWNRPRAAHASWTDRLGRAHPAVTSQAGGFSVVSSGAMGAKAVVLRSRRD